MNEQQHNILQKLQKIFPKVHCALNYSSEYELAIAVILSAQCTDERVNKVTPSLFSKIHSWKDVYAFPISKLETHIFSTGFYKNKAQHIHKLSEKIIQQYSGHLPSTLTELVTLPGIGRKTANVLLGELFQISEGIVVDTHVLRISHRIGFASDSKNAVKKEKELMNIVPKNQWYAFSHRMILLGRSFCTAKKPQCKECPLSHLCPKQGINFTKQ